MTKSCFLIQLIDKENYNGIRSLHRVHQDIVKTGQTTMENGNLYIQGIEPRIERKSTIYNGNYSGESTSIWFGWDIISADNLVSIFNNYQELKEWVWDYLYILRFIVNWNLKARIFLYTEWNEGTSSSNCSFQETLDPFCDSGSNFHIKFNRYDLIFPILKKLFQNKPSDKFKAILYNFAHSKKGNSVEIDYFYEFTVLEGIIANWTESNGYSELWGNSIANSSEQHHIHEKLRKNFQEFLFRINKTEENYTSEKKSQLESLRESYFSNSRKIRRSIKQRFLSYKAHRLSDELNNNEVIEDLKNNFHRIYTRRNEIGHSLENYTTAPEFTKDSEILSSAIKILMDFEFEKFIEGEIDWKFEEREKNLSKILQKKTHEKILDKFIYSFSEDEQTTVKIQTKKGFKQLRKVEYHSNILLHDGGVLDSGLRLNRFLKIFYSEDLNLNFSSPPPKDSRKILIDDKPDCLIYSSKGNKTHIFHTCSSPTSKKSDNGVEYYSEIDPENIRTIIKLENVEIPTDFDFFENL